MKRFVEGEDRRQGTLLPEYLEDYVSEENPVRVIDVFVDELDLQALGFAGVVPEVTGRPSYHPGLLLKIYVYGYINQIASTRRLERDRRHAGQAGPQARRHAHPPGYRRTRLRHAQSLDGSGGRDCLDRDRRWLSGISAGCDWSGLARHAGRA